MGTSKIWFKPSGADRMAEIDLGRYAAPGIIDGPSPVYHQTVQESISGVQSSNFYNGRSELTLGHDWTRGTRDASGDGDLVRRKVFTWLAHLQRGGTCAFALDHDFAWAGFATHLPASNASSITIDKNLMANLGGALLATGRELMVQTDHDDYLIEMKVCGTQSGRTFPLSQNLAMDMTSARWVLVREYYTYPALRMPLAYRTAPLTDFLAHDHERIFHLRVPLEEDPAQMDAYNVGGGSIPGTGHGPGQIEIDPEIHLPHTGPIWKG